MSQFTKALIVSPLSDGKTWVLIESFGYDVGDLGSNDTVEASKGFMTDFTSIPRLFWAILPRWGKYGNAAVIHDWIYWKQNRTRYEADSILFEAMGVLSVPSWKKYSIYYAVRLFGWFAWIRNRWDKDAGFSRKLKDLDFKSILASSRPGFIKQGIAHFGSGNK